jgi:putative tryptophan/tyrosine transport system substrate-binding protein
MRRREFITLLGGAAAAWSFAARAQERDRAKRIGVLIGLTESDSEGQARVTTLKRGLEQTGWINGKNARIEVFWAGGDTDLTRRYAAELVASSPDVIVVNTPVGMVELQKKTRTLPIVFVQVSNVTESGLMVTPARPEANLTGFTHLFDYGIAGKWLQLLKEIAPNLTRVGILMSRNHPSWRGYASALNSAASLTGIEIVEMGVERASDIEPSLISLAQKPTSGIVVPPDSFTAAHRDEIIRLAEKLQIPSVYGVPYFAYSGGLIAYGANLVELFNKAAIYVDRILRGESPSILPVQSSTSFNLIINLKTAKALGLSVPPALQARADEMIE